jgi:hypothetical protein
MNDEKRMCENTIWLINHKDAPAVWIATNPGGVKVLCCDECRKAFQEVDAETAWIPLFEKIDSDWPKDEQPTIQCDFTVERDVFGTGHEIDVRCPDEAEWRDPSIAKAYCSFHKAKWLEYDKGATFIKL